MKIELQQLKKYLPYTRRGVRFPTKRNKGKRE